MQITNYFFLNQLDPNVSKGSNLKYYWYDKKTFSGFILNLDDGYDCSRSGWHAEYDS